MLRRFAHPIGDFFYRDRTNPVKCWDKAGLKVWSAFAGMRRVQDKATSEKWLRVGLRSP